MTISPLRLDTAELERQIKALYRQVAQDPEGRYHFPTGASLAKTLGYPEDLVEQIPPAALASFAGVGYPLELTRLNPGERVLDLGSGSGTDTFAAAVMTGPTGQVTGVDMTDEQLAKAEQCRAEAGLDQVSFVPAQLEKLPFPDEGFDMVISNGVINLCPDKAGVFAEAARVLKPGGRLAISDIISTHPMPETITCSVDLWSSCIGGAAPESDYRAAIAAAGLEIHTIQENPQYAFLSPSAQSASRKYDVRSITLLAVKTLT